MAEPRRSSAQDASQSHSAGSAAQPAHLPLAGISVVECGQGVAAAYAAKLLTLLGAEVVKVEPPGGDITRRRGPFFDGKADPEMSGLSSTSMPTSRASPWTCRIQRTAAAWTVSLPMRTFSFTTSRPWIAPP